MDVHSSRARPVGLALLVCIAACSSPTSPTLPVAPVPPDATEFVGEWVGTNSHGAPVSFSVSGDHVTLLTLSFSAPPRCMATETLVGPSQIGLRLDNQQGFLINKLNPPGSQAQWGVAVYGVFNADRRSVFGEIITAQYPGCGTLRLQWSAQRR